MLSIVIPTYNRRKALERTLPSYLNQKFLTEVIVVDDGSVDGTESLIRGLIEKDSRIKYIKHEVHKGAPAARNTGFNNTTGQYILFGEDDVFLQRNYSDILLKHLKKNAADLIAGRLIYLHRNEKEDEAIDRMDKVRGPVINKKFIIGNFGIKTEDDVETPFLHSCSLIHREVLEEIEHDEEYGGNGYREETDFHVKAAKHGFRLVFCPHTVCFHLPRIEGSGQWSMSRITYEYWTIKNNNYFLRKHYPFLKERLQLNENVYRMAVRFSYHRIRRYIGLKVTELARMRT